MCWAGVSRIAAIAARLGLSDRAAHWQGQANSIGEELLKRVWNPKRNAFAAAEGIDDMDASVLLLPELGLIDAQDPRFASTVAAIESDLVSCAMRRKTISACRKPNSWSAASG
jgi:GH15 family glucan-1,4-alpha-glucosidase